MPNERGGGGGNGGSTATVYWPRAVAADAGHVVQQSGRDSIETGGCIIGLANGIEKLPPAVRRRALRELDFELARVARSLKKTQDAVDAVRDIMADYAQQLALEAGRRDAADE